jgi:hypothetical protein
MAANNRGEEKVPRFYQAAASIAKRVRKDFGGVGIPFIQTT